MTKKPESDPIARLQAVLESAGFFETLGPAAIEQLLRLVRPLRLQRGQAYQSRGNRVDGFVIVLAGYLRVSLSNNEGKRHVVTHLGPGRVFNLLPVMDGGTAIHDAEAGVDTELALLPAEPFRDLLRRDPAIAAAAQQLLNSRTRQLYAVLADIMLLTLNQRCARMLLELTRDFGESANGAEASSLRLSQNEFAEMLGNARPVVNRALMQLQRQGVIELGYQRITVLDADALRQAAGL